MHHQVKNGAHHAGCAAAYDGEFRCDFLLVLGHVVVS